MSVSSHVLELRKKHQALSAQVEAAHNDTWASYRVDISCADPAAGPLIAWLLDTHAGCPRT